MSAYEVDKPKIGLILINADGNDLLFGWKSMMNGKEVVTKQLADV